MRVTRGLSSEAFGDAPAALTIGNFDGVHRAHLAMLQRTVEAASDLDLVPTVLTFHPSPKEFFARQAGAPMVPRLSTVGDKLARFKDAGVDRVVIVEFGRTLSKLSATDFIATVLERQLRTRWLLVGDDFRFGHKRAGTVDVLRARRSGAPARAPLCDHRARHARPQARTHAWISNG
jgi:riboflavin kinase/FMN adenylyltransferase